MEVLGFVHVGSGEGHVEKLILVDLVLPHGGFDAADAVQVFLKQSPAFEGAEVRLWDNVTRRFGASVEWHKEKTDFGFAVSNRANVFHDRLLGLIARQVQVREEIREEIQHSFRMSA